MGLINFSQDSHFHNNAELIMYNLENVHNVSGEMWLFSTVD